MGILHRLFARSAPDVWQTEMRLMHSLGYVHPPQAVQWISTSACDLSCPHCYSNAGRKDRHELSTQEAKTLILDELVRLGRPTFVIAGGETLLRRDFPDVIAYAHERKVPWAIHTHGGRVEKLIDAFEKFPPMVNADALDAWKVPLEIVKLPLTSSTASVA